MDEVALVMEAKPEGVRHPQLKPAFVPNPLVTFEAAMKEVIVDATAIFPMNKRAHLDRTVSAGVVYVASRIQNLDILKLILEHVQEPEICTVEHPDLGIPLPFCAIL